MCHRQVQCARHGCGHDEPIGGDAKVSPMRRHCICTLKLLTTTERWIANPLNVDTVLHIHEAVQFALAHVFNSLLHHNM